MKSQQHTVLHVQTPSLTAQTTRRPSIGPDGYFSRQVVYNGVVQMVLYFSNPRVTRRYQTTLRGMLQPLSSARGLH